MKFNPLNLYKLHLNNNSNLADGDGTGRFKLNLPAYLPKNKRCFVYVEQAQLQVKNATTNLTDDYYSINSNLISQNSYSNNNKNQSGVLCNLSCERKAGQGNNNQYVELLNQTNPLNIGYLPNEIELFISNPIDNTITVLNANFKFNLTLCCQFVDDDDC